MENVCIRRGFTGTAGNDVNVVCRFGSWAYSSDIVDIVEFEPGNAVDVSVYDPLCTTVLQSYESRRNVKMYPCCPEPYADITINLMIARRQDHMAKKSERVHHHEGSFQALGANRPRFMRVNVVP